MEKQIFDPDKDSSTSFLPRLRTPGFRRQKSLEQKYQSISPCLKALIPFIKDIREGVYIDGGSGDAGEIFYMAKKGWKSYGIDCFAPIYEETKQNLTKYDANFIKADLKKSWDCFWDKNIGTGCDVITFNAMIDLIPFSQWSEVLWEAFDSLTFGDYSTLEKNKPRFLAINFISLCGSENKFYFENPIEKLLNTVEEINFPLIGRTSSNVIVATTQKNPEILSLFQKEMVYSSTGFFCDKCGLIFRRKSCNPVRTNCPYCFGVNIEEI